MSILLKNGTVIDYKNSIFEKYDMLIENETISNAATMPKSTVSNLFFIRASILSPAATSQIINEISEPHVGGFGVSVTKTRNCDM